jgi:hypothetical protein
VLRCCRGGAASRGLNCRARPGSRRGRGKPASVSRHPESGNLTIDTAIWPDSLPGRVCGPVRVQGAPRWPVRLPGRNPAGQLTTRAQSIRRRQTSDAAHLTSRPVLGLARRYCEISDMGRPWAFRRLSPRVRRSGCCGESVQLDGTWEARCAGAGALMARPRPLLAYGRESRGGWRVRGVSASRACSRSRT